MGRILFKIKKHCRGCQQYRKYKTQSSENTCIIAMSNNYEIDFENSKHIQYAYRVINCLMFG